MGDKEFINKKKEEELKKEDELERRIKEMKKERIKSRRRMPRNQPTRKMMKMEDGSKAICLPENRDGIRGEKRRGVEEEKDKIERMKKKKCTKEK